jgi:hypothetical protein
MIKFYILHAFPFQPAHARCIIGMFSIRENPMPHTNTVGFEPCKNLCILATIAAFLFFGASPAGNALPQRLCYLSFDLELACFCTVRIAAPVPLD